MANVVWALLGLTAICGTVWSYPAGLTTLDINEQIHVLESSSSSEENVNNNIEATLTATTDVDEGAKEDSKDETSNEESRTITEEWTPADGGVEHEEVGSAVELVSSSSLRSSTYPTEEVEEREEPNTEVSES